MKSLEVFKIEENDKKCMYVEKKSNGIFFVSMGTPYLQLGESY